MTPSAALRWMARSSVGTRAPSECTATAPRRFWEIPSLCWRPSAASAKPPSFWLESAGRNHLASGDVHGGPRRRPSRGLADHVSGTERRGGSCGILHHRARHQPPAPGSGSPPAKRGEVPLAGRQPSRCSLGGRRGGPTGLRQFQLPGVKRIHAGGGLSTGVLDESNPSRESAASRSRLSGAFRKGSADRHGIPVSEEGRAMDLAAQSRGERR